MKTGILRGIREDANFQTLKVLATAKLSVWTCFNLYSLRWLIFV